MMDITEDKSLYGLIKFHSARLAEVAKDTEKLQASIDNEVAKAYQRGLEEGKKAFDLLDEERDAEYQRGLDDAWEAARNISMLESDGGYSWKEMKNIFGTDSASEIYVHHTATEAINKIKAYEEKQKADDKIEVGDEVTPNRNVGWKGVVVGIDDDNAMVMTSDGYSAMYQIEILCKTGRHFDIESILEDMRND